MPFIEYHLFPFLTNFLNEQDSPQEDDTKRGYHRFFNVKSPGFCREGMRQLPICWQYIVNDDSAYSVY
uniref:Ovule protein n=1 Tax=Caenorhabditis tropicalis TaxID=1561998 RepID=A0A1I7UDL0_9PELO